MKNSNKTASKLKASVISVVVLAVCLLVTSIALVYSVVSVDENSFALGEVKINLNDGNSIIEENEFVFEPGMTVNKDFFVQNDSTIDVYYKLYFSDIEGELADILDVTVYDGNNILFTGKASAFTKEKTTAAQTALAVGERRTLKIAFHFPENAGKETSESFLSFAFGADAVQAKNNPDRLFE